MSSRVLNSIYNQIRSKILLSGPITVAEYMKLALTQQPSPVSVTSTSATKYTPGKSGYYMDKDVFGQHGDFITSPEISQLFGEVNQSRASELHAFLDQNVNLCLLCFSLLLQMIGVWGIDTWRRIGGPKKFSIVELGPGRGTLANDVLRVISRFHINTL